MRQQEASRIHFICIEAKSRTPDPGQLFN